MVQSRAVGFTKAAQDRGSLRVGNLQRVVNHYETLKECDGVLFFWGKAKEGWLRSAT